MLFRKRDSDITKWLKEGKKALLVTGARQVGKTYLIEEVLKRESVDYIKFDLIEQPEVASLIDKIDQMDVKTFISRLTIMSGRTLKQGKTVLFFDEIQRCKEIVTKVKYLVQEGIFRYVFSGSLLGVELSGIQSAPVGFLQTIELFPMDFEEFLYAAGLPKSIMEILKDSFFARKPVDDLVHRRILDAFYRYLVIGGMPEAVQEYIDTNDYNRVLTVHNTIVPQYKRDFTQYELQNRKLHLINTYELIPSELNKKNKRYTFTHLDKNLKMDRYEDSFQWLIHAGVSIPVYNIDEPKVPLAASRKSNLFKLFLSDVGLLSSMYGRSTMIKTLEGHKGINYGAIFENAVAQELHAHGYKGYYFNSKKQGEIDFVIEYENSCIPIEVKSGKDYTVHTALNNVLNNPNYDIKQAIVLCQDNVWVNDKTVYLPIYMIMFFDEYYAPVPRYDALDFSDLQ